MKKILVTGGCGFIGSNLVRHLVGSDVHVLNVDALSYAGNPASLGELEGNPNYRFEHATITDRDSLDRLFESFQPDSVMHLAAESHVDRSIDGPGLFIQTNVIGTFHLLQAALKHYRSLDAKGQASFRFLHVSTDEVYGSLGETGAFTETTPYDPHSPYSATKASSDHLVRAWHDTYGLPVLITNCSNNYGPYQYPEKLIPVCIIKTLSREQIPVYGTGENTRDWLYVEDHVRALVRVLEAGKVGETYNIGGNNERQNIELVRMVCGLIDEELSPEDGQPSEDLIHFVADRPGHDFRYAIDATKISTDLGWSPVETFDSGFRKTVRWYLENRDWWQPLLDGSKSPKRLGLGASS